MNSTTLKKPASHLLSYYEVANKIITYTTEAPSVIKDVLDEA